MPKNTFETIKNKYTNKYLSWELTEHDLILNTRIYDIHFSEIFYELNIKDSKYWSRTYYNHDVSELYVKWNIKKINVDIFIKNFEIINDKILNFILDKNV